MAAQLAAQAARQGNQSVTGNPTPPHTPTPPQELLNAMRGQAGSAPQNMLVPNPLGLSPNDLLVHQQFMYAAAANHPAYAADLRALGLGSRFPYPAMAGFRPPPDPKEKEKEHEALSKPKVKGAQAHQQQEQQQSGKPSSGPPPPTSSAEMLSRLGVTPGGGYRAAAIHQLGQQLPIPSACSSDAQASPYGRAPTHVKATESELKQPPAAHQNHQYPMAVGSPSPGFMQHSASGGALALKKELAAQAQAQAQQQQQQQREQQEALLKKTGRFGGRALETSTLHGPPPAHALAQQPAVARSQPPTPQTPPHGSVVPPPTGEVQMLSRYPVMWQGLLALKNDQAAVQMHFVSGNSRIALSSLPALGPDGGPAPVRIAQRMRLEPAQLDGVARKMQHPEEHCILLALPCGRDHIDVMQQSHNLRSGFINYLSSKQAAGIVNAGSQPGTGQVCILC